MSFTLIKTLKISFLLSLTILSSAEANCHSGKPILIMIKGLTANNQSEISAAFEHDLSLELKHTCLPSGVILFESTSLNNRTLEDNFNYIQRIIASAIQRDDIQLLVNYSEADIMNRCNQYRPISN